MSAIPSPTSPAEAEDQDVSVLACWFLFGGKLCFLPTLLGSQVNFQNEHSEAQKVHVMSRAHENTNKGLGKEPN